MSVPEEASPSSLGQALGASLALALAYVLSLYMWAIKLDRDHPSVIKRRFFSAFLMLFLSPPFVYLFGAKTIIDRFPLHSVIGLRIQGLGSALTYPIMLTWILFLGPIIMAALNDTKMRVMLMPRYWSECFSDLIWWRNHLVAPFTEEYTFRACMLPILLGYFTPMGAVFVAPLFFGVAHLHHMIERIRKGHEWRQALLLSLFQMTYTTLFGMYSAFLFVRTGHLAAPVLIHGFCNFMGFPDFLELWNQNPKTRLFLLGAFVLGLVTFFILLFPMTEPGLYQNNIYNM